MTTQPCTDPGFEQLTADWDTAAGIKVSWLGEDTIVLLGHHATRLDVAVVREFHNRFEPIDCTDEEIALSLVAKWARFQDHCPDVEAGGHPTDRTECPACRDVAAGREWCLTCRVDPTDPRAFPITVWTP